jgi:glutaminyl-tRNA synthetase
MYDRLFSDPLPDAGEKNFLDGINPSSLQILTGCKAELSLADATDSTTYQFEREGYFCKDAQNSSPDKLTFNQTIALRSAWAEAGA